MMTAARQPASNPQAIQTMTTLALQRLRMLKRAVRPPR